MAGTVVIVGMADMADCHIQVHTIPNDRGLALYLLVALATLSLNDHTDIIILIITTTIEELEVWMGMGAVVHIMIVTESEKSTDRCNILQSL